ncbi:MAG: NFACT family protein, partial [Clostridiales bacterium]|nr:NFACT family protein [Clostridiales bacterium]
MALDGIVVANLAYDLNRELANTRISKISQPEADELMLTLKGEHGQKRLLLSATASL